VHFSGSYFILLNITHSFLVFFKGRVLLKAASFINLRDRFEDIMPLHVQEQSLERDSKRPNPSLLCIYKIHAVGSFLHKPQRRPSALKGRVSKEAVFVIFTVAMLLHRHLEVKRHLRESLKVTLSFFVMLFPNGASRSVQLLKGEYPANQSRPVSV
jgi:hypothetical protein